MNTSNYPIDERIKTISSVDTRLFLKEKNLAANVYRIVFDSSKQAENHTNQNLNGVLYSKIFGMVGSIIHYDFIKAEKAAIESKKLKKLNELFFQELGSYDISQVMKLNFIKQYSLISKYLDKLNYQDISLEIVRKEKLKFTLLFEDDKILMINKPIGEEFDDNLIIYSFFIDDDLISSNISEISCFFDGFKEYISL